MKHLHMGFPTAAKLLKSINVKVCKNTDCSHKQLNITFAKGVWSSFFITFYTNESMKDHDSASMGQFRFNHVQHIHTYSHLTLWGSQRKQKVP